MSYDTEFDRSLGKNEIIRGYDSFKKIFARSKVIENGYLKCYLQFDNDLLSPQSLKVGFTVSKRKARKAFVRNRIKRLIKEAYRNEKHKLLIKENTKIIFTVSESGGNSINLLYKSGFILFTENMRGLFDTINKGYVQT